MKITITKPGQQPKKQLTVADLNPGQIGIGLHTGSLVTTDGKNAIWISNGEGIAISTISPNQIRISEILPPGTEIKLIVE